MTPIMTQKQQAIIEKAYEIFYREGFHATAIDKLLTDSGISKRTVYKYFPSKEALIAAAIIHYNKATFEFVASELEKRAKTAKQKILVLFDLKKEALEKGDRLGCFAVNARLEYKNRNTEIENACDAFLNGLEGFIKSLCKEHGCKNPAATAQQILLLFQGAIIYGQAKDDPSIIQSARKMAETLL